MKKECPVCNSKFVYVRIKKKELVCRSCGHIMPLDSKDISSIEEDVKENEKIEGDKDGSI